MALKTPVRPPAYHKKISGAHHRRSKKYHQTYWPYLPLLLIIGLGLVLNVLLPGGHRAVLGYATDMSTQTLLQDTNQQRTAAGETALQINQQLATAAQAKAKDMASRNYWSHNTPDGQTPWSFMINAGYNYALAGENLAYGFANASDTMTGWMNSPEHRANILNAKYQQVGFGFINIQNYQHDGPETLVVAMYGTPMSAYSTAVADSAAPTISVQNAMPPANQTAVVTPANSSDAQVKGQTINRLDLLTSGKIAWSTSIVVILAIAALVVFLLRHAIAWHKILVRGERFLLRHPALDMTLVSVVMLGVLLIHRVGVIR